MLTLRWVGAQGKLALLKVYSSPLSVAEAHCLFVSGDVLLMGVGEGGKTHDGGGGGGGHRRELGDGELAPREEEEGEPGEDRAASRPILSQ